MPSHARAGSVPSRWQRFYRACVGYDIVLALVVGAILIGVGVFLGYNNNQIVPLTTNPVARYTLEPNNPLSFMANWDGPDYLTIAVHGYTSAAQTNFFPLYPLLTHLVNIVADSPLDSALAISWTSLIGAIYVGLKVVKRMYSTADNLEALRAVAFFMLFPSAVFLLATYTESLFAVFALGALYSAQRKKYIPAALLTMCATATHITGIFVLVLVAMVLWEQKERLSRIVVGALIGSLGMVGYMTYLQAKFHSPIEFITAQQNHGWLQHSVHNPYFAIGWLNVILVLLIITAIVYWWRRGRKSFSVYAFLFLCIPVIGGQFGGFNRYVLMAFPVQFMLYDKFRTAKLAYPLCITATTLLWAYFLFQYAGGYVGG